VSPGQKKTPLAEERLTEMRNPDSMDLDRLSTQEIIRLMNEEDRKIAAAVAREIPAITRAVEAIVNGIRNGGRLFYVGAGSSGRLGVLDAAECAPTFGTSRKLVQALIAGGKRAMTNAVEGAEDSTRNGERDLDTCRRLVTAAKPRGRSSREPARAQVRAVSSGPV